MDKYAKYIRIIANILLITAILFFVIAMLGKRVAGEANIGDFEARTFNEGWVFRGEGEGQEIVLPTVVPAQKGETIAIENVLPDYVKDGMRLSMRTAMQDAFVYIGDELRESYTGEALENIGNYAPSSYILVDLTEEDAGKTICIQLEIKKNGRLNEIKIAYGNNMWFSLLQRNVPVGFAAVVLVILGVFAGVLHFALRRLIKSSKAVLFLGQVMVIVGLWILSESHIRQLIFRSPSYTGIFAYMLIELLGGFVAIYFNEVQKYYYNKAYMIIETLVFGQALLNIILALSGVAEFYVTLPLSHVWMIVGVIVATVTVFMDIRTGRIKNYLVTAVGMLLFIVSCIIEMLKFYFIDFHILGVYLCIGLVVLLITTIIQVMIEEYERIKRTIEMKRFQSELEQKVAEQTVELRGQQKRIKGLFVQTVTALSEAVDAKDRYTSGHSKRVAEYSRMIAARMGKSKEEQDEIYHAGLLHDVGKIRIPAEIINKPGKLTDEEFDIIKIHPVTGFHILRGISDNSYIAVGAKYHHERYDGRGYPNGLSGEKIPEVARILGVADAYDAMASNRSYRNALPQEVVRNEIEKGKGTQFDPDIAEIMLQMIDEDRNYSLRQIDSEKKVILVVDDEAMNNKIIAHIMRDEPVYEVVPANSGKEALKILEQQQIDLILLDVMMPEMDGLETLKRIRENYQLPVVLMTSDKTLDTSTEFARFGCDDYITKPFLPLLIKEVVHNMTERTNIE